MVLRPDDEVDVFLNFRDFTGKYVMHGHNLVHEDHAMMIRSTSCRMWVPEIKSWRLPATSNG